MSELWLCRTQKAITPYRINEKRRILTAEELCFYLMEEDILIEDFFFSESLFDWLRDELLLPQLALHLSEGKKAGKSGLWCSFEILKELAPCTREELDVFRNRFEAFAQMDELEAGLMRADKLLSREKYQKSIRLYETLLTRAREAGRGGWLRGRLWHNLGVANAQLFYFDRAQECFANAYEFCRSEDNLLSWQIVSNVQNLPFTGEMNQAWDEAEHVKKPAQTGNPAQTEDSVQAENPEQADLFSGASDVAFDVKKEMEQYRKGMQ